MSLNHKPAPSIGIMPKISRSVRMTNSPFNMSSGPDVLEDDSAASNHTQSFHKFNLEPSKSVTIRQSAEQLKSIGTLAIAQKLEQKSSRALGVTKTYSQISGSFYTERKGQGGKSSKVKKVKGKYRSSYLKKNLSLNISFLYWYFNFVKFYTFN